MLSSLSVSLTLLLQNSLSLRVYDALSCTDLGSLPIQYVIQFGAECLQVPLTRRFIRHLCIFPDQPNAHRCRGIIIFQNIALNRAGEGVPLSTVDRLQLLYQLCLLSWA